jgi:uncharacterized protein (DUF58 family)
MTTRGATRGAYLICAIGGALYLAARTTGAGWLMVLLCAVAGVLAVATIWPRLALFRVRLLVAGPHDATAGQAFPLTVGVAGAGLGVRVRPLDPPGGWSAVVGDATATSEVTAGRRGVIRDVEIEVSSAAPFGLVWWRRRIRATLEHPIDVAPRRGDRVGRLPQDGTRDGDAPRPSGLAGDRVRGLREYVPGDPMRLVHWPASAKRGQVLVKELEQPQRPRVCIVVALDGGQERCDETAERAMGLACHAMEDGVDVLMCTAERGGPVAEQVGTPLQAGRRLARAVPGEPAAAPAATPTIRVAGGGTA